MIYYTGWFLGIPVLDYYNPQWLWRVEKIRELIINQQGFETLLKWAVKLTNNQLIICYSKLQPSELLS
jgi:hypothetical protein